jgi:Holliday junction resolvase
MRTAARRDEIEVDVVIALQNVGCSVWRLNDPGVPDLLVGRARQTYLLEVKDPKGTLTKKQRTFHTFWRGGSLSIVRSPSEALRAVGAIA